MMKNTLRIIGTLKYLRLEKTTHLRRDCRDFVDDY